MFKCIIHFIEDSLLTQCPHTLYPNTPLAQQKSIKRLYSSINQNILVVGIGLVKIVDECAQTPMEP